jgi:predicted NAD/FAD-binding protein
MSCQHVRLPDGTAAIVCGPSRRFKICACGSGKPAKLLCDWKSPERESGACDAAICEACSTSPAPDKDLCPAHARAWVTWKTERAGAAR